MIITPCSEIGCGLKKMSTQTSELDMNHWLYRFLATIIDGIIIAIPTYLIYWLVLEPLLWPRVVVFGYAYTYAPFWALWFLYPLIFGLVWIIYAVIMESSRGATVGKQIFGLKVQMVNGGKVVGGKAFMRNFSKILWFILL